MSNHLTKHQGHVSYDGRCKVLNQKGLVVWFTGLSGSGKSTIASALEKKLYEAGYKTYHLDGDNIRHGLNSDLSFSDSDRAENIRRVAEVAALFKDAGLIALVSFISPHRKMREYARELVGEDSFIEVYVKASLETCMRRDPKGLYAKARAGEIDNFTGVSAEYEAPIVSGYIVNSDVQTVDQMVTFLFNKIFHFIQSKV